MNPPNPKLAALAICEALRGDDFSLIELEWVESVIRAQVGPSGHEADATPLPAGRTHTHPSFPPPLREAGLPAALSAVTDVQGPLGRRTR